MGWTVHYAVGVKSTISVWHKQRDAFYW